MKILKQVVLTLLFTGAIGQYTNESEVPYYGLSPPVYPSPEGTGNSSDGWKRAYQRAKALVDQMTLEEKANITRGYTGRCIGNSGEVSRLGVPSLCFHDGPAGVRTQEFVSGFPGSVHVAATWDKDLYYQHGKALGEEFHGKGINVALLPCTGPLGRIARGGRNWEGLSADPYLAGEGMGLITKGLQSAGVIATIKHWLAQEQEWRRRPTEPVGLGEAISSNLDDRTLHELYAFPFMNGLKEGAGSVMCSYQRINNSYGCQNSKLMNGILKSELGFEGFVVSDWGAQHAGVATANAGLDVVMPDGGFWGQNLTDAVNNGSVTAERVADMATRVLTSWYYLGQDNGYPKNNVYPYTEEHEPVDVRGDHASLIRKIGAAGTILVKNTNGALPLKKPRFVSLYGPDAPTARRPWQDPARYGGNYAEGWGWNTFDGTLVVGGGSGGAAPPYVVSPFEAIRERVTKDGGILRWDFESINPSPRFANSDVCLVFINSFASERWDRVSLTDEFGDELVNNVAANCSNTIVVVHSAGIRVVDAWVENPNVTAVVYGLLPGQESGNSLVDLLWGDISPSGKMPFTVAKKEEDYGHLLNSTVTFDAFPQQDFTEGLYIDYRAFDKKGIEPRYEFGFGLSYSAFEIGDLKVNLDSLANIQPLPHPNVSVEQGGHPELWEVIATATASMTNTGNVTAAEVAQLYVGIPGDTFQTPIRQLRGFQKVTLLPGKTTTATFPLTRRDLSVWDVTMQQWRLQSGSYKLHVGSSSRDLTATQQLVIRN